MESVIGKVLGCYEVSGCRGVEGGCRFGLAECCLLAERIAAVVERSAIVSTAGKGGCKDHLRLKVAIAGCPNACSGPQIKDVGIIANVRPCRIGSGCDGCGGCEEVCREGGIKVEGGIAKIFAQRCVGCGLCIKECAQGAIESEGVRFRILVGGRMGRHPKFGQELCVVQGSCVGAVVESFLKIINHRAKTGERIAAVVERIGIIKLKEEIFADVQ